MEWLKDIAASGWTLFLDRDGVINRRLPGRYVEHWSAFEFLPGATTAIARLTRWFSPLLVVTNQQGIGKGLMTLEALEDIHHHMQQAVQAAGGQIDAIYACPELAKDNPLCRKPNIGMALEARTDFPQIDFHRAVMVGDSASDMEFGRRLGMKLILIEGKGEPIPGDDYLRFSSLEAFADQLG